MLSALYAMIAIVRPSVCLSVRRVDHRKTVEVRIMKFSPYGSPITLVFAGISFIQKFESSLEQARQTREGWEKSACSFSIFKREYL